MRRACSRLPLLLSAAALLGACHHEPAGLRDPDAEALDAAPRFSAIADSLRAAGADRRVVDAYAGIARALATHARTTPVRIAVDGVERDWLAVGREVGPPYAACPSNALCAPNVEITTQMVVAWERAEPRRMIQLTRGLWSYGLRDPEGITYFPGESGQLAYLDGRGGLYTAPAGTQSIDVTHTDWPCASLSDVRPAVYLTLAFTCTVAGMHTSFEATVHRPLLFGPAGNPASGTHTLAMPKQEVDGARLELASYGFEVPPPLLPPLVMRGTIFLPSTLKVTVDTVVHLRYDVFNASTAPAELRFATAQQVELLVEPSSGGEPLWRWSADRMFAMMETTRVLQPGEHWIVEESWRPTAHGALRARALATSTTHFASAMAYFTAP